MSFEAFSHVITQEAHCVDYGLLITSTEVTKFTLFTLPDPLKCVPSQKVNLHGIIIFKEKKNGGTR